MTDIYTTPNGLWSVYMIVQRNNTSVYVAENNTDEVIYYVSLDRNDAIKWANNHWN